MGENIKADYLSYNELRGLAEDYLGKHHPNGGLPIPIEDFIDLGLKIDIVPVEGLLRDCNKIT